MGLRPYNPWPISTSVSGGNEGEQVCGNLRTWGGEIQRTATEPPVRDTGRLAGPTGGQGDGRKGIVSSIEHGGPRVVHDVLALDEDRRYRYELLGVAGDVPCPRSASPAGVLPVPRCPGRRGPSGRRTGRTPCSHQCDPPVRPGRAGHRGRRRGRDRPEDAVSIDPAGLVRKSSPTGPCTASPMTEPFSPWTFTPDRRSGPTPAAASRPVCLPDEEQPDDEPACLLPGEAPLLVQTEKSVRLPLRGSSPK